jgi:asparagine synthase (glutamine-hydrolysing)
MLSTPLEATRSDVLRETLGAALRAPSIPWLMRYADRNAMAFSVENRVPFLNTRLVDFALGVPEDYLIGPDGLGKQLLRRAMRGMVPDVILARRKRIGFDVPVEGWLARTPGVPERLSDTARIPAIDQSRVAQLRGVIGRGGELGRAGAFEAWRLVTLSAWAREFSVTFA